MEIRLKASGSATSPSRLPGLDRALNPYRGCSHACSYCYAQDVTRFEMGRPWGSVIEVKTDIVQRLRKEIRTGPKGVYGVGTVTDPYQPLERKFELTRGCLKVLKEAKAKASILTKSDMALRDLDILADWTGVEVGLSVATLDDAISKAIEPGASPPRRRIDTLAQLAASGVNVYIMIAPIIPGLSDSERSLRELVEAARDAKVHAAIWDKFNPRPMATSRLRKAIAASGLAKPISATQADESRIASILRSECRSAGIVLEDAF